MWYEMHKHTQYSMFDGFDKIKNIVAYAVELGMPMLGISDHGNASGIMQLYLRCKEVGIKPLMGSEVYFQPSFNKDKRYYHLCLFAKNAKGYSHLCQVLSDANEQNFFRTGKVTFEILEKYHEDLICSSACVAGFISQYIIKARNCEASNDEVKARQYMKLAHQAAKKFKSIFGDDFYFEIMPIEIDEKDTQKYVNQKLMSLARKLSIKCILTTDSHYTRKEDFDSYVMMHKLSKIGGSKGEGFTLEHIKQTYAERYMHSQREIAFKLRKMHGISAEPFFKSMDEIYEKVNVELDFADSIPTYDDSPDCYKEIKSICLGRLKETTRYTKPYLERLKYEISVIKKQSLCDYFMIVYDYVRFARENNIYVGPGRGSVCGSLLANLLQITKVDPLVLGTDFERFLRPDKKKMPDIDIDFENGRQTEIIEYIINKYKGRASKIVTFGYYKGKNLLNDLCKIYRDEYEISDEEEVRIKTTIQRKVPDMAHFEFEDIGFDELMKSAQIRKINTDYPNIVKHFCKLFGQVKYYGQHPAGVLVTRQEIGKYVPMSCIKGQLICSYDKYDSEGVGLLKFDVLALKTMNVLHEIEESCGDYFDFEHINPKVEMEMYSRFKQGKTLGIFQLNKKAAQDILVKMSADNLQDVIAAISLNRPGPLKLHMHDKYAANKQELDKSTLWYPYTKDAYGTVIYQEHVMKICKGVANMDPNHIDKIMKFKFSDEEREVLRQEFIAGAKKTSGVSSRESGPLFDSMTLYLFNKGHAAGYAMISEWEMYHKVRHPTSFWYATIKHEIDERTQNEFMAEAVVDGIVLFLPHVNSSANYSIRSVKGEEIVQMGTLSLKGVGGKAAAAIEAELRSNGKYTSYEDFIGRLPKRVVNIRVVNALINSGALEFDKKVYKSRIMKYNTTLYAKGMRMLNVKTR